MNWFNTSCGITAYKTAIQLANMFPNDKLYIYHLHLDDLPKLKNDGYVFVEIHGNAIINDSIIFNHAFVISKQRDIFTIYQSYLKHYSLKIENIPSINIFVDDMKELDDTKLVNDMKALTDFKAKILYNKNKLRIYSNLFLPNINNLQYVNITNINLIFVTDHYENNIHSAATIINRQELICDYNNKKKNQIQIYINNLLTQIGIVVVVGGGIGAVLIKTLSRIFL